MKGAIIGDIVGSVYEFHNRRAKDFPLFSPESRFTDDTVMTLAVAIGMIKAHSTDSDLIEALSESMHDYGNRYPGRGYGGRFRNWLRASDPRPYNSWGNGAPMRCSSAGWIAATPAKAFELGMYTAAPTHNHPDAMKAAGVTAMLIWYARQGKSKEWLKSLAEKWYALPELDDIRDEYSFDVSCEGTMPVALSAFFESQDFEDAIRNAVSIGGDSDTIAAIAGSIAEAYYGVPDELWQQAMEYLSEELRHNVIEFFSYINHGNESIDGTDSNIPASSTESGEKSCNNCQLRKSGNCPQLSNELCSDYRAIPFISKEEKKNWPEHGDATAFRLGEKRD